MRAIGLTALAAVLFAGGFAFVRAQEPGLTAELAALERALAEYRRAETRTAFAIPPEPAPIHRIPVITTTSPLFARLAPGDLTEFYSSTQLYSGPPPEDESGAQPYGTIEEMAELLTVRDGQAGYDPPGLHANGHELIFRGSKKVADRIEGYLENELRPRVLRTALFEVDWEMGQKGGDPGRGSAENGEGNFRARMLSLLGSRGMFWVGRQQAVFADSDVSPTFGPLGIVDPRIDRVYTGEWVLPDLIAAGTGLQGPVRFESRRLDGALRRFATRRSGTLDMVRLRETATRPFARLIPGEWERVHAGEGVLRVRARILERGDER